MEPSGSRSTWRAAVRAGSCSSTASSPGRGRHRPQRDHLQPGGALRPAVATGRGALATGRPHPGGYVVEGLLGAGADGQSRLRGARSAAAPARGGEGPAGEESGSRAQASAGRLLREARAMARLEHPNVVTVHDAGELGGQVFVAMQLVEGGTLRSWLAERRRSWREALGARSGGERSRRSARRSLRVACSRRPRARPSPPRSGACWAAAFAGGRTSALRPSRTCWASGKGTFASPAR